MGAEEKGPAEAGTTIDAEQQITQTGTYRSLGEQKLSPQEERFERGRRTVGLFLAPAVIIVFLLLPLDLDPSQHKLAAILLGVVTLWITEAVPIPIGGLIGIALIVLLGVGDADTVLAPFGSSTVFTFIGAFIIAQAMLSHGVARRFAFRMLAVRGVSKTHRPHRDRLRADHRDAVGVRVQHRHRGHAAADRHRHPGHAGQPDAEGGRRPTRASTRSSCASASR